MAINFKDAVGLHADALQLRAQRTRVLASNIANENTPGYSAQDIDFKESLARVEAELAGEPVLDGDGETKFRVPYHPAAMATPVEIGVEQAAFSQNATDFATSLTFHQYEVAWHRQGHQRSIRGFP